MILTINGGSSSIKFAVFSIGNLGEKILSGQISRIGFPDSSLSILDAGGAKKKSEPVKAGDYPAAIKSLLVLLEKHVDFNKLKGIGHRIVHGMQHTAPALITATLLKELKEIILYDPDHLPSEIKLIEAFSHYTHIPQFACFDTAFHRDMPRVAKILPIPRRFEKLGIQRYGFHGLSYNYLMLELEALAGKKAAMGRVVLAHLGNGASLAAVYKGKSIDTSMGFTPAAGIPMSTRTGDLDPGVAWMMMKAEQLTPNQFNQIVNKESGMLGISASSGDMNDLLAQEKTDVRSAEAVDLFCYQVKKWIGAFAAAMGGIDTLVFAGGIGENAPEIRKRICKDLSFLGIALDSRRNNTNQPVISKATAEVSIRVIHTDEEAMISKIVNKMIAAQQQSVKTTQ